jgi:hypothetical protein
MLGAPQLASAQSLPDPLRTKWWVIDLGMPCGCESAAADIPRVASSVNDCGEVVGSVDKAPEIEDCKLRGFGWQLCDTLAGFPNRQAFDFNDLFPSPMFATISEAHSINNDALVVGAAAEFDYDPKLPTMWDLLSRSGGSPEEECDFGTTDVVHLSASAGIARSVANHAAPSSVGEFSALPESAWFADPVGPNAASNLPDQSWGSLARGVEWMPGSSDFRAVGEVTLSSGAKRGASWDFGTSTPVLTLLGDLFSGPFAVNTARANAVNSGGEAVGFAVQNLNTQTAALWEGAPLAPFNLGAAFDSSETSEALSISEPDASGVTHACGRSPSLSAGVVWRRDALGVWSGVATTTLQLRHAPGGLPVGCTPDANPCEWSIERLNDVNALGWMAARGTLNCCAFPERALLLVPSPCQADISGDNAISSTDLSMLLSAWGPCAPPCAADIDGDDVVGASDLSALLTAWGAPCTLDAVCASVSCERGGERTAARAEPDAALMAAVALFGFESTEEFSAWLASLPESLARSVGESLLWQLEIHNNTGGAE